MNDRNGEANRAEMSERSFLPRSDTEQLLSYYESPLADGIHRPQHRRQLSGASTSGSDYSDSSHSAYSESEKLEITRRRQSNPSEGGSDRRRLAIVEMDTVVETSVKSRRGIDIGSLALVAPPDAAPQSYTQLTPPTSTSSDSKGHQRSASEVSKKSSPRDVGIIGTSRAPIVLEPVDEKALRPPIFIHPQSRSPSPSPITPPIKRRSTGQSIAILTPEIGASKQIDIPVASPVVVGVNPSNIFPMDSSPDLKNMPSSFLNYQPGVHATAGPLPPPPRASFAIDVHSPPPPRPPRLHSPSPHPTSPFTTSNSTASSASPVRHRRGDIDAVKQALQLPPSVSKALESRSRSRSPQRSDRESETKIGDSPSVSTPESVPPSEVCASAARSIHRREGAFAPSSGDTSSTALSEPDAVIPPSLRRVDHHLGDEPSLPLSSPTKEGDKGGPPITEVHPLKQFSHLALEIGTGSGSSTSSYGTPHPREGVLSPPSRDSSIAPSGSSPNIPDDGWVNVSREEGTLDSLDENFSRRAHVSHSQSLSVEGLGLGVSPSGSLSPSPSRSHSPSSHGHDSGVGPSRHTSVSGSSIAPSPPPKSFRNSFTNGLKRMSLPRSPSGRSLSLGRAGSVSRRDKDRSPRASTSSSSVEGGGVRLSTSPSPSVSSHPLPALPLSMSPPAMPLGELQMNSYAGYGTDREDMYEQTPTRKYHATRTVRPPRIKSVNPSAMFCSEVTARKSAGERCALYAQKINELYLYDCGLEDWVTEARIRGSNSSRSAAISLGPSSPSTVPFTTQPRQTSHSSVISDATFPRRPDATSATDLTMKEALNMVPPTGPPPLPYPSLANQRSNPPRPSRSAGSSGSSTPVSSLKSLTPSTPTSKTGGFFASLGRKASVSRRDKSTLPPPLSSSSSSGGRLTKPPPSSHHHNQNITPPGTANASPSPAVRTMSASPAVPGGPRAPPNRMLRSQTIMVSPLPGTGGVRASMGPTVGRRPSLYNIPSEDSIHVASTSPNAIISSKPSPSNSKMSSSPSKSLSAQAHAQLQQNPEFLRQVDKLADLLPHADRDVLAGYLRRAGQDILAIGQYLEDEKNGKLRRD